MKSFLLSAILLLFCVPAYCQYFDSNPPCWLGTGAETLCAKFGKSKADVTYSGIVATSTLLLPTPVSYSAKHILIDGILIVDSDIYAQNCRFQFTPGSELIIYAGASFAADNSKFFSCQKMWKGIDLTHQGKIVLNYCQIEDAQYAIETYDYVGGPSSTIRLIGNRFNRNFVSIIPRLPHIGGATQKQLLFTAFSYNTFTCDGPLNTAYTGQMPLPAAVSFAGIQMENCLAIVGTNTNPIQNYFSCMQYGIWADQSDLKVVGCSFTTMVRPTNQESAGIYALNHSNLMVYETLTGQVNCSFEDCGLAGILTDASTLRSDRNFFKANNDSQRNGINSRNNANNESMLIQHNTFDIGYATPVLGTTQFVRGISIERPDGGVLGASINIYNNIIDIYGDGRYRTGIVIDGTNSSASDFVYIWENLITIRDGYKESNRGIALFGGSADNYIIFSNQIFFSNVDPGSYGNSWGISGTTLSGFGHDFSGNTIFGLGINTPFNCAFHLADAMDISYCVDSMRNGFNGFHFVSSNPGQDISNCDIGDSFYAGLRIDDPFPIGFQLCKGNTWSTNPTAYSSFAIMAVSSFGSNFNVFPSPQYCPSITNPAWVSPPSILVADPTCTLPICGETPFPEGKPGNREVNLSPLDQWYIDFTSNYKSFVGNPDFIPSTTNNTGVYAKQYCDIRDAKKLDQDMSANIDSHQATLFALIDDVTNIWCDSTLDAEFRYEIIFQQLLQANELSSTLKNISSESNTERDQRLSTVLNANDNLPTASGLELKLRTYFQYLILKTLRQDASEQQESLRDLALVGQDSLYGFPVRWSRSLLSAEERIPFDIEDDAQSNSVKEKVLQRRSVQNSLIAIPNPCFDEVRIEGTYSDGSLKILDSTGRCVLKENSTGTTTSIQTSALADGVYFIIVYTRDGEMLKQPISLVKKSH